ILVSLLIVVALRAHRETAFRSGLLAGLLVILVALTGGFGLPVVLPGAARLFYLAAILWRDRQPKRAARPVVLPVLAPASRGLYFASSQRPAGPPPPSYDPLAVAMVTGEVLGMALGIGFVHVWWAVLAGEVALGAATIALLVRRGKDPAERPAAAGLVAVVA